MSQLKTVVVPISRDTLANRARAAKLFVELCGETTMEVSVGNYGVKFTGTAEQIAHGERLVKEARLVSSDAV